MRKTILLGVAAIGLLFSSCLGDNDTTISGDNAYGVVTSVTGYNGNVLALSTGNYIIWDDLNSYQVGDAMTISSFKFGSADIVSGNIIRASYISVGKNFPDSEQERVTIANVDTTANVKAGIGAERFSMVKYDAGTFFTNRMFMSYTVNKTKSQVYNIEFVYDGRKEMQIDAKGQPLTDGYRVLDVILTKIGDDTGTVNSETTGFVANMTNLRNTLKSLGQKQIVVNLRYSKYDPTTKEYATAYEPNFFYMNFEQ